MPTSQHHQIPKVLNIVIATDPASILDIGVGFGKYGVLAREYLELWDGREEYERFRRRIDGIEVYRQYLTPVHAYVYDHIYEGNALEVVPELTTTYDLILLIDVLEHFEKDEGRRLLEMLLRIGRGVLVSVPKDIGHQGEVFGNVHETHHAAWKKSDFSALATAHFVRDTASLIVYLGRAEDVRAMKAVLRRKRLWRQVSAFPAVAGLVSRTYGRMRKRKAGSGL